MANILPFLVQHAKKILAWTIIAAVLAATSIPLFLFTAVAIALVWALSVVL